MPLGEVDGVMQHVQLGKGGLLGLRAPVLMDVVHCTAPGVDVAARPVARVKKGMKQLLQPTGENGMRCAD